MLKYKIFVCVLVITLLIGCKNSADVKDFTYRYSMESVGNYKVEFEMNSDSTFRLIQNNYFFDKFEGTSRPVKKEGVLNKQEYDKFFELINKSNINKMKDAYGFEESDDFDNSIVYIIELFQNQQSKFVSINASTRQKFSNAFTQLIEYTNEFINTNLEE